MSEMRALALVSLDARQARGGILFHLAHKLVERGERVLVVDGNQETFVTESFLSARHLYSLWAKNQEIWWHRPFDASSVWELGENLHLVPGDPRYGLASEEPRDFLSQLETWIQAKQISWLLVDPGLVVTPWSKAVLGLARASLVITSLHPKSLRALEVAARVLGKKDRALLGYLIRQPLQRVFGPGDIHAACLADLPAAFQRAFGLDAPLPPTAAEDPFCLGLVERPAGLYELASEVGKPAFQLRSADGASESLLHAAFDADRIYDELVGRITRRYDSLVSP